MLGYRPVILSEEWLLGVTGSLHSFLHSTQFCILMFFFVFGAGDRLGGTVPRPVIELGC
jgi:hypothetical protein